MKVLQYIIPPFLIKKNSVFSFLIKGFKEMTTPKQLASHTRIRWFQKGNEKVTFFEGKIALHKHNITELSWEGIVLQYTRENPPF